MTKEDILQKVSNMVETIVYITFMEDIQMNVFAMQDCAPAPYIDCIIPTDRSLVEQLESLDTVNEVNCYYES